MSAPAIPGARPQPGSRRYAPILDGLAAARDAVECPQRHDPGRGGQVVQLRPAPPPVRDPAALPKARQLAQRMRGEPNLLALHCSAVSGAWLKPGMLEVLAGMRVAWMLQCNKNAVTLAVRCVIVTWSRLMFSLVLTFVACIGAATAPDRCRQVELPWDGSLMQCMLFGQHDAARWTNEHPGWVVTRRLEM